MGEHNPHRESCSSPPELPLLKEILLQCPLPRTPHLAPAPEHFPAEHQENSLESWLSKSNLFQPFAATSSRPRNPASSHPSSGLHLAPLGAEAAH